jgi:putative peptide zinc metalloprotease protein
MSQALFSPSWYRVATLAPRLRSHAQLHRHQYRGQTWYVLRIGRTNGFIAFSRCLRLHSLMDGRRTVQDIWELACTKLGDVPYPA